MPNCNWTSPERSRYSRQSMRFVAIKDFQAASSLSELTPTSSKGWVVYLRFKDCRTGTDARQGGHQVPQKSRSTTFPWRAALDIVAPSRVVNENLGAKGSRARMGLAMISRVASSDSVSRPG